MSVAVFAAGGYRTCACELRSPKPFTEQGFIDFNRAYVQTLERWGLCQEGRNPVARTNVCPAYDAPAEPSFHAFSYTVPARSPLGSFVVAGSGEAPEGKGSYRDHVIRPGDVSRDGLRDKMRFVTGEMGVDPASFQANPSVAQELLL